MDFLNDHYLSNKYKKSHQNFIGKLLTKMRFYLQTLSKMSNTGHVDIFLNTKFFCLFVFHYLAPI